MWRGRPPSRDTGRVAITPASAASSAANFFRSVIAWLQVGYPEGVPGPDRVALLALLRSTPLTEDEVTEVVDAVDEEDLSNGAVGRDVIADFISDMTHYDAGAGEHRPGGREAGRRRLAAGRDQRPDADSTAGWNSRVDMSMTKR